MDTNPTQPPGDAWQAALLDAAPAGMALLDEGLCFLAANAAFAALAGRSAASLVASKLDQVLPHLVSPALRVLAGEEPQDAELPAGRIRCSALPGSRGLPAGVVLAEMRPLPEAELRRRAAWFGALAGVITGATIVTDATGVIVYASTGAGALLGYEPPALLGASIFDAVHRNDLDRVRTAFATLPAEPSRSLSLEMRMRAAATGWRDLEVTAINLLHTPEQAGVVLALRDVTLRRWADEVVRFFAEAGRVLNASLDVETTLTAIARLAVPRWADWCGMDLVEEDGQIARLVTAARSPATEAAVQELYRRYPHDPTSSVGVPAVLRSGHPELVPQVTDDLLAEIAVDAEHLHLLRALGMTSYLRVPLTARGRTLGVLSFVSSSRLRYNQNHLAVAVELARRSGLALDNARLYREAQEALAVRAQFLSSVSHQLRTPLTAIKAAAQFLERRIQRRPAADAVLAESLATISSSATRMAVLVGQLLDLSRLQSGRTLEMERRPVDLVRLLRTVADDYRRVDTGHAITIEAPVSLTAEVDPSRIEWLFANLTGNAVKYSPRGGPVTLVLEEAPLPDASGRCVRLTVRDQGMGIPAADLPHVFERFRRGGNVGAIEGTGLGLAMTHEIATLHGGRIALDSREGEGTTVTVWLPLDAAPGSGQTSRLGS